VETPLQVVFKDTESSEFIESHIRERVARLERFHPHIISCRVVVEVPHRASASGKTPLGLLVEIEVPGRQLVAKASDDMRETRGDRAAVMNRTFDVMQRQLDDDSRIRRKQVKHHESAGLTGTVARLFPEQDYGFIEMAGQPDLHFTRSSVSGGGFDRLEVGMAVVVAPAAIEGPMGPQASSVQRLGEETHLQ
jgi:ribosome-associated translation inhibitor RaiA/cold shock CspA family protein